MNKERGLSVFKVISIGLRALSKHWIRFCFVTILFALTLSFFIFSMCTQFYDKSGDYLGYYRFENKKIVSVVLGNPKNIGSIPDPGAYVNWKYYELGKACPGLALYPIYAGTKIQLGYPTKMLFRDGRLTSGIIPISNKEDLEKKGFRLNAGAVPQNESEVCISEFDFQLFKKTHYQADEKSNNMVAVQTYDDIIGKETIHGSGIFITGIVDTFFNSEQWIPRLIKEPGKPEWEQDLANFAEETRYSANIPLFVSEKFVVGKQIGQTSVFCVLSDDDKVNRSLFDAMARTEGDPPYNYRTCDTYYSTWCQNQVSASNLADQGLAIMAIFGVFTMLMMFQFIGIGIKNEQRSIGIYRALGAKNSKIFGMFATESAFSAMFALGIGSGLSFLLCTIYRTFAIPKSLTTAYVSNLLTPQWFCFVLGAVFAAAIVVIGTLIPLIPILKKKPAEIIRT